LDASTVFLHIAVILIAARLGGEIASRLGAPSVIGELGAGIVLGPSLFGWLEASELIHLLAEIGIIMLLFEVGLDTDLGRLAKAGARSVVVAIGGFVAPFLFGFGASYLLFEQELAVAMFVGGTLTATSIGVTVRVMQDVGRQGSAEGQIVLGAAVLDDILGVLLLAVLFEYAQSGSIDAQGIVTVGVLIAVFFALAPPAAKAISFVIGRYQRVAQLPGLIATMIVSLILLCAWLAHAIGAPELLGGFTAGLALSRRFFLPLGAALSRDPAFSAEVERDMKPIIQLFTPIFFVTVGLSLDFTAVDWTSPFIWLFSIGMAVLAILSKVLAGHLLFSEHPLIRTAVGMAMVPRGEVGLIFAELGRSAGLFDPATYTGIVLVIAYTTLFSPFWIKLFYRTYGDRPALQLEA